MSEAMGAMSGVRRSPPGAGCPPGLPRRHPGAADPVTPVWTRGGGTWSRLLRRRVRAEPAVTDLGAHPLPWLAGFLRVTGDGGGIAAPSREGRRDAGGLRSLGATRGARELARWMLEAAVRSIGRRPSGCLRRAARTHWAVPRPQAVGSITSLTELPAARLVTGRPPTDQRTGPRCARAPRPCGADDRTETCEARRPGARAGASVAGGVRPVVAGHTSGRVDAPVTGAVDVVVSDPSVVNRGRRSRPCRARWGSGSGSPGLDEDRRARSHLARRMAAVPCARGPEHTRCQAVLRLEVERETLTARTSERGWATVPRPEGQDGSRSTAHDRRVGEPRPPAGVSVVDRRPEARSWHRGSGPSLPRSLVPRGTWVRWPGPGMPASNRVESGFDTEGPSLDRISVTAGGPRPAGWPRRPGQSEHPRARASSAFRDVGAHREDPHRFTWNGAQHPLERGAPSGSPCRRKVATRRRSRQRAAPRPVALELEVVDSAGRDRQPGRPRSPRSPERRRHRCTWNGCHRSSTSGREASGVSANLGAPGCRRSTTGVPWFHVEHPGQPRHRRTTREPSWDGASLGADERSIVTEVRRHVERPARSPGGRST